MRRTLFLIPLAFAVTGCISYCKSGPILERAATGDLEAMAEVAELGRPRVPSSAEPLAPIRDAFAVLVPHLASTDEARRLLAVEGLRKLSERAPDVYRNHFPDLFVPALRDPSSEVRARGAWALGRLGETNDALGRARDDKALDVLARGLDRAGPVALAARGALARLSGQDLTDSAAWKDWVARRLATRASIAPVGSPDAAAVRT